MRLGQRWSSKRSRVGSAALAVAAALVAAGCRRQETPAPVVVRNPDYVVVRTIRLEPDAEHLTRVDFPSSAAGYGYASSSALLDLNSFDLAAAAFAGGRTSIVGEATIWLPLTPEGSRRLDEWSSAHPGEHLGVFLKGRLVEAPQVRGAFGGGIPLRVSGKTEGDVVLKELRNGGV
jgi:hypothetical protein